MPFSCVISKLWRYVQCFQLATSELARSGLATYSHCFFIMFDHDHVVLSLTFSDRWVALCFVCFPFSR